MTPEQLKEDCIKFKEYLDANGAEGAVVVAAASCASMAVGPSPQFIDELALQILAARINLKLVSL